MKLSYSERQEQRRIAELRLTENLIANKQSLEKLLASCNDHWGYEDPIYRFYHQSFKVFIVQESKIGYTELMQWGIFYADLHHSSNLHKLE